MESRDINEAKRVLQKGLRALVRRDFKTVYDCLQLTNKVTLSPEGIRKKLRYGFTLITWIGKVYVITDCAIDFDVTTLSTKGGIKRFRIRMIKEKEPYIPSCEGTCAICGPIEGSIWWEKLCRTKTTLFDIDSGSHRLSRVITAGSIPNSVDYKAADAAPRQTTRGDSCVTCRGVCPGYGDRPNDRCTLAGQLPGQFASQGAEQAN